MSNVFWALLVLAVLATMLLTGSRAVGPVEATALLILWLAVIFTGGWVFFSRKRA